MITSLHYYNYYRPRILKTDSTSVKQIPLKQTLAHNASKPYNLSRAYNDNVINYAKDLSDTVNGTKISSNAIVNYLEDLFVDDSNSLSKKNKRKNNEESLTETSKKPIKSLVDSLNKIANFEKNVSNSAEFNAYSKEISEMVENSDALREIGVSYDNGKYIFDESKSSNMNDEDFKQLLTESYQDIKNVNTKTNEFLSKPISNHMTFKSFSYYYSYSAGIIKNDSFNLISTGTLLDLQL